MKTPDATFREGGAPLPPRDIDARLAEAIAPELELVRVLGQGVTARVYLARDVTLDRHVTVKVLHPELTSSAEARARFEREARAAANISHPNVSSVFRVGALPQGQPYMVMQYVRGRSLKDRLAAEGALTPAETRQLLADIASALAAAHAQGVVHRDVRPDNILLDEADGRAVIADFGVAALTEEWGHGTSPRLTATGQLLGDPHYVSPEQLRGEPVTGATDVYSMALVACEMLTGRVPHADSGAREALVARLTAAPVTLPEELERSDPRLARLLHRCLAPDPRHRPSARTLARQLAAGDADSSDASVGPLLPLPRWAHRGWHVLARRHVPHWVAAAAAAGWALVTVVDDLADNDILPDILYHVTLPTSIATIAAAAILAWFHGERGEQRFSPLEIALLALVVGSWLTALVVIVR